jgi:peptide-methionine (R)-S-oxide reductase
MQTLIITDKKRKFLRIIGLSLISIFLPFKYSLSESKKTINPNLSNKQKNIMFKEGTERPYSSDLLNEKRKGFYHCANCGNKLFASNTKFDSGTGWPSFSKALPGAFNTKTDYSFGRERVEYHCANCGAHHGHVFNDGPKESGKRFCNNGLCLIFKPE